jgi:hypothetical protein
MNMNELSESNFKAADKIQFEPFIFAGEVSWRIALYRGSKKTYVWSDEDIILYPTEEDARAVCKDRRPDLF